MLGDIIPYQNYSYEVILCRPDKTEISMLDVIDIEVDKRYNGIDQLNFEINWQDNDWIIKENPNFYKVINDYLIKLVTKIGDEIIEEKLFIIDSSPENYIEKDYKDVHCFSYEYSWVKKLLRGYKKTAKLYDTEGTNGILNYILDTKLLGTWSINYISSSLLNNFRSFDFSENTLIDVIKQLEETYACLFFFNTIDQSIDIVLASESGVNTGLFLDEQVLKNLKREILNNEIYTRLYFYGKDNLTIASKNLTGQLFIDNFSFYRTTEYMSQSLLDAFDVYDLVLETQQGVFEGYLEQLETLNTQLSTKENELKSLETEKKIIQDSMRTEKNTYTSDTDNYENLYDSLQDKESQISVKETEINAIKSQINSINTNILNLNNLVSYQNNFTTQQLKELMFFIREQSITVSNIDNVDTLFEESQYQLSLLSTPIMQAEVSAIDLYSSLEHQRDWKKLKLGDIINVYYDKMNIVKNVISPPAYLESFIENQNTLLYDANMTYTEESYGAEGNYDKTIPLRLISIKHNPSSNTLNLTFCTTNILSTDHLYLRDINVRTNRFANTLEVEKPVYEDFQNVKKDIVYNGDIIDTDINPIVAGNIYINSRGFTGVDIGSPSNSTIEYLNDKIIISSDGMRTYDTLISGNGFQLTTGDKSSRILITRGNGFQLDVFNTELNDYRNAIYLGLHGGTPSLFIDNGFIKLTRISGGQEINDINIDPEYGIRIRAKVDGLWQNRLYADNSGNLIAEKLRTFGDGLNYVGLESQFLNFWNNGLNKLKIGFQIIGETAYPYSVWGAGDGSGLNQGFITKYDNMFTIRHRISTYGEINSIDFMDVDANYPLGAIKITTSILDFNNSPIRNFSYSYSKSDTYTQTQIDDAIANAIADHEATYHTP